MILVSQKAEKITLSTKTIENDICAFFQKAPAYIKEKHFAVMCVHLINLCPTFS